MYAAETNALTAQDEYKLKIFECKSIRKIVKRKIDNENESRQWMKLKIDKWVEEEDMLK